MPRNLAHRLAERFAELRDREQAVAAELEAYQALLDLAPCPMVLTTDQGAVVYVNKAYCELLATTLEDVAVNGWLQKVVPEDRERVWNIWQQVIQRKTTQIFDCVTFLTPNGPTRLYWKAIMLERNGYAAVIYHPGCLAADALRLSTEATTAAQASMCPATSG